MTEHKAIRFLSIVLALLMSVSLLFLSVSAETPESEADVSDLTTLIIKGDVYQDGIINMKDVLLIRWAISGCINYPEALFENFDYDYFLIAGDVDENGMVSMKDVLILRQYISGLIPSFDSPLAGRL